MWDTKEQAETRHSARTPTAPVRGTNAMNKEASA